MINSFLSFRDYSRFATAREYFLKDHPRPFEYSKNFLERIGDILLKPTLGPVDLLLRNIKNPLTILALAVTAIFITTIIFYPAEAAKAATTLAPFLVHVEPWMTKFALFSAMNVNILGLGLRTLGRLCNKELMPAWEAQPRAIKPIAIGTAIVLHFS